MEGEEPKEHTIICAPSLQDYHIDAYNEHESSNITVYFLYLHVFNPTPSTINFLLQILQCHNIYNMCLHDFTI